MFDEVSVEHESEFVDSWSAALELLSEYPWAYLHPLKVHPEFRQRVLDAVVAVYAKQGNAPHHRLEMWREVCGVSSGR